MGIKFNPFTGNFDTVVDQADQIAYDNSTSGLTATEVQSALDEIDTTLDTHLNAGASKHDADQIDYERADGSKKNIQASSDDVESALDDLDDAIGVLNPTPTNYTPASPGIVASHLGGIDTELGNILSTINNFTWQEAAIDKDLTAPPGSPTTGDRYLLGLDTAASVVTGAWAGHDGEIAEWNGSSWDFTTAVAGSYLPIDDENDGIYLFGGVTWTKKYFEATTASGFLSKTGFDIQLTNVSSQNIIVGNGSNVATALNTSSVGDILADTTTGLTIKSNVIVDADINASAAITLSKLAALTTNRALISDGSGIISVSTVTNTELGHVSGVTSAIQTQLDSKTALATLTTKGDIYVRDASTVIRLGVGANNQALLADSTTASGLRWGVLPTFIVNSVSTNTNAVNGETYLVDSSGGTVQITLPAPSANAFVKIKDSGFAANTFNITVARNASEEIEGVAGNYIIDSNGETKIFVSDGTDWFIF